MSEIKLYKGDNIEVLNRLYDKGLDMNKVIFVTDPPFNIGYHYKTYKDKMNESEYYKMLHVLFRNRKHVIIHYAEQLFKYAIEFQKQPEKIVSWVYNSNTAKQHRQIAFFDVKPDFRKVGQPYKNPTDKRIAKRIEEGKTARLYDWWEINQVKNVSKDKTDHPCQMPYEVMRRIIGILPEGYTIIDPFMGSGTTALACMEFKRDFIGIEMDENYFNIAVNRINKSK